MTDTSHQKRYFPFGIKLFAECPQPLLARAMWILHVAQVLVVHTLHATLRFLTLRSDAAVGGA